MVITPASACGGPAVLSLLGGGGGSRRTLLLVGVGDGGGAARDLHVHLHPPTQHQPTQAVEENTTEMQAFPERLFPPRLWEEGRIVRVRSYLEAMGFVAAHKAGLNPGALTPNVGAIRQLV